MRHFILPRPIAARSRRVFHSATMACLVAPPRRTQRPPARVRRALGAVDMTPIEMAADERLGTTAWVRAQKQPGRNRRSRHAPADGVDARRRDCDDAPAIVPLHGVGRSWPKVPTAQPLEWPDEGRRRSKTGQVMDRRRAGLPIPAGLPHHPQTSRGQTLGRSVIPACPGGSTGTSRPLRFAAREGRYAPGAGPSYGLPGQSGAPKRSTAI